MTCRPPAFKGAGEIGEDMAIARTTVAFHLRNLLRKTNTTRQADRMMLLMQSSLYLARA